MRPFGQRRPQQRSRVFVATALGAVCVAVRFRVHTALVVPRGGQSGTSPCNQFELEKRVGNLPARGKVGPDSVAGARRRELWLASTAAAGAASLAGRTLAEGLVGGEQVKLANGLRFPKASFGLQVYDDATGQRLTELAISVGYRNFFASVLAGNQRGFARGVANSGVPREELFICGTVLSNDARGFEDAYRSTKQGCKENLDAFAVGGITYVDMIMLDYPGPDCDSIRGQWKAFEEMYADGTTKSLAVSNFSPEQLDCLLKSDAKVAPVVNQLPYSVGSYDRTAVEENRKRGIVVQAWSPLGGGLPLKRACKEIGKKYAKSSAQVALRWIVQTGATFTTQSRSKEHFTEDLQIYDFSLTEEEMRELGDR